MIVVFGSLNVDLTVPVTNLPEPGETVLGPGYQMVPGGKGANQALGAARAGAKVAMVGKVGRDSFADVALTELRAGGVDITRVERDDHPTGCAFICVDSSGQNQIVLATGANATALERQVPDEWLTPETVVMMQMEVWPAQNWALVARASARGARILLNAAPAGPIPGIALAALDWLIVNETEAVAVAAGLGLGPAGGAIGRRRHRRRSRHHLHRDPGRGGRAGLRAEAVLAGGRDGYFADRYHRGGRCLRRRLRRRHRRRSRIAASACIARPWPAGFHASPAVHRPVCR